ncbi:futalosine hydrolase [Streptomyces sp. 7-21]|uniref:futalosine hydrolase n=1 Tax=Streptomyces sp. 7-21 TaxID=2802283 RepID=UPI001920025C|nr:futalosine hydrolase [Streptomyces sp. 7-21]MBL1067536.1 futalosine hydrolase [Streptomyces sp. 7-21]
MSLPPRVLVVTAVPAECEAVARAGGRVLEPVAAGVGPAAAAAQAAARLATGRFRAVISAGIGGGFAPVAPVGSVVVASRVVAADLGVRTADGFTSVTDLGFGTAEHLPPEALARPAAEAAGAVFGPVLTVSTVTGTAERAAELAARYPGAAAEAMEGFGVAEAARLHGVPVLEVRAVSNAVGPRDRAAWRVPQALTALSEAFGKIVPVLETWNFEDPRD